MSKNIKTLIGVLLDVSGSMESSVGDDVNESGGEWARSIFRVIDDLIKHDVTGKNEVFALAFGSRHGNGIFDIISTLKGLKKIQTTNLDHEESIDRILNILQNSGASSVRKWATTEVIKKVVSHNMAKIMHCALESNPEFVESVVEHCLPSACKGYRSGEVDRKRDLKRIIELDRIIELEHDGIKELEHNMIRELEYHRISELEKNRELDRKGELDSIREIDRIIQLAHQRFGELNKIIELDRDIKLEYDRISEQERIRERNRITAFNWIRKLYKNAELDRNWELYRIMEIGRIREFRHHSMRKLDMITELNRITELENDRIIELELDRNRVLDRIIKLDLDRNRVLDRIIELDRTGYFFDTMFSKSYNCGESVVSTFLPASEHDVKTVLEKAKGFLLKGVSADSSIFKVKHASNIIHGCVDEEELTENRVHELMDIVRPFIYGRTPLFVSLLHAIKLFADTRYQNHKKLLFVLSDGKPTDQTSENVIAELRNKNVHVISCFITRSTAVDPHKLYSQPDKRWEDDARFMFDLSSKIKTQLLPRTIFIKRGWEIDITNNETNLFLQVNHPDNIKDACDLARNVVCCQDALADILSSVSLDIYINQCTAEFGAKLQVGGTCYANASAAVLHLSMKRIIGRENGYPDFIELRRELIDKYGMHGANVIALLETFCPKYRLRYQRVNEIGAMHAITAKRPVIALFWLTDKEWDIFSNFYKIHKTGILTKNEINLQKPRNGELKGHAVVLTSFNSQYLYFMNSWGTQWGDNGFFRVQNAYVLKFEFIDVFWILDDLTDKEKIYYKKHGSEVADTLMKRLHGLLNAKYTCPKCSQTSLVTEFTGHLSEVQCPKCRCIFVVKSEGNILALNLYLTSLSK